MAHPYQSLMSETLGEMADRQRRLRERHYHQRRHSPPPSMHLEPAQHHTTPRKVHVNFAHHMLRPRDSGLGADTA